jgi:hypothetical protein
LAEEQQKQKAAGDDLEEVGSMRPQKAVEDRMTGPSKSSE